MTFDDDCTGLTLISGGISSDLSGLEGIMLFANRCRSLRVDITLVDASARF